MALLAVAGVGCGSSHKTAAGVKGPSEVVLAPVSKASANPFTAPVGKDLSGVKPPAAAVSQSGGLASYTGSLPGLYGGTRDYATCNPGKMVRFLEQNPAKAAAWAGTLGIQTTQIRQYVKTLTAVTLRVDTRVTNHGYIDGRADAIQSVLEAGTAVLVDNYGRPVVKCYCGNPLTPPVAYSAPTYTGPAWAGFAPAHITVITQSTTIIQQFTLFDPATGETFARPAGTSGGHDGPYATSPGSSTTQTTPSTPSTSPPQSTPPPASTPAPQTSPQTTSQPQVQESPSAAFNPSSGMQGDTFVLSASGFAPNVTLDATLTRPDGVVEHYSIDTGSDGSGSHTFTNTQNVVTGHYSVVVRNPSSGASADAGLDVAPAGGSG
jgi:hypothetical protein